MEHADKLSRKKFITRVLAETATESTVHGIPRVLSAKSRKVRVFWVTLIIMALIGATIHLSIMVNSYLSYPIAEVSSTKEGVPIDFPSVTICNINPISIRKIEDLFSSSEGERTLEWFQFVNDPSGLESFQGRLEYHQAFYENLPNMARKIGHSIDDLILYCRFDNKECGPANFSFFFDTSNYYSCYTFNSGFNIASRKLSHHSLLSSKEGVVNGLSLIISLNEKSPAPGGYGLYDKENVLKFGAGTRVQIHAAGTMPSPASLGFDVSPGFSTTISVGAVVHSRLDKPHGNCTRETLQTTREYRNTVSTCLQICKQKRLLDKCGCKNSGFTVLQDIELLEDNVPYCSEIKEFSNWTSVSNRSINTCMKRLECEEQFFKEIARSGIDEKSCGCFPPCTELTYTRSVSTSYWPMEFFQLNLLQKLYKEKSDITGDLKKALFLLRNISRKYDKLLQKGVHVGEYNKSDYSDMSHASELIRQNLIRLNIYVDSFRTTEFRTVPTYGIFDLLADVGGTLGLWLGISLLTIMELIELNLKVVQYLWRSKSVGDNRNDKSSDVTV